MMAIPCGKGGATTTPPLPDEATIDPADALAAFERDFATLISRPWPEGMTMTVAPLRPELPPEALLPAVAPLPSLPVAFSRRAALFGAVTTTGLLVGSAAASVMAPRRASADAHLVELVDAYEVLDRTVNATLSTDPGYGDLIDRYMPLETEIAETPSASMVGVLAKARACQLSTLRDCADTAVMLSIADDLVRLQAMGALA